MDRGDGPSVSASLEGRAHALELDPRLEGEPHRECARVLPTHLVGPHHSVRLQRQLPAMDTGSVVPRNLGVGGMGGRVVPVLRGWPGCCAASPEEGVIVGYRGGRPVEGEGGLGVCTAMERALSGGSRVLAGASSDHERAGSQVDPQRTSVGVAMGGEIWLAHRAVIQHRQGRGIAEDGEAACGEARRGRVLAGVAVSHAEPGAAEIGLPAGRSGLAQDRCCCPRDTRDVAAVGVGGGGEHTAAIGVTDLYSASRAVDEERRNWTERCSASSNPSTPTWRASSAHSTTNAK